MNNKKGFTLIELLAMLVVLGLLIGISIPNVTGILKNQRLNVIKTDANNMVEKAKAAVVKDPLISKPKAGECLFFTLEYLNDNDDFDKGPNGGTYELYDSFVIYERVGSQYKYYVRLVENVKGTKYGFDKVDVNEITELNNDKIVKITKNYGLSKDKTASVAAINNAHLCTGNLTVDKYFVRK